MSSLLRALFTGTSKHKKLSEEWATLREPVVEGVTFYCKYLGSTLVDDPKGEAATAEAIKRIIHTAKLVARKPELVGLHVSLQGIRMEDSVTKEVLLQTSIYKISYCSADAHYDHVFAFIATTDNETCECHAFLCPKRKMAQEVTISIAQAFNLAYECWKVSLKNKENDGEAFGHEELPAEVTVGSVAGLNGALPSQSQPSSQASSPIPIRSDFGSSDMSTSGYQSSSQALLIDLEDSAEHAKPTTAHCPPQGKTSPFSKPLNATEDLGDISDGFSRLALRRGNLPQPMASLGNHQGLGELGLAASPTESVSWPSTSLPQLAATPLATSPPPDPWGGGGEGCQSPTEAWEMFSRSPNTAFLHSCQSPPSPSVLNLQSPPQSPLPQLPPQALQSPFNSPFSFPQGHTSDLSCSNQVPPCPSVSQRWDSFAPSPTSPIGRENPFLPTTNPFIPSTPVIEVGSAAPPQCPVESPRVVMGPGGSGCSPGRPVWTADFFSGSKSKNVICS